MTPASRQAAATFAAATFAATIYAAAICAVTIRAPNIQCPEPWATGRTHQLACSTCYHAHACSLDDCWERL